MRWQYQPIRIRKKRPTKFSRRKRPSWPPDPMTRRTISKPPSGEIYNACKNVLGLTQCGNDAKTFMRDTLAPLIKPGMAVYEELKRDIFGTTDANA